jgi:hypothetical protein
MFFAFCLTLLGAWLAYERYFSSAERQCKELEAGGANPVTDPTGYAVEGGYLTKVPAECHLLAKAISEGLVDQAKVLALSGVEGAKKIVFGETLSQHFFTSPLARNAWFSGMGLLIPLAGKKVIRNARYNIEAFRANVKRLLVATLGLIFVGLAAHDAGHSATVGLQIATEQLCGQEALQLLAGRDQALTASACEFDHSSMTITGKVPDAMVLFGLLGMVVLTLFPNMVGRVFSFCCGDLPGRPPLTVRLPPAQRAVPVGAVIDDQSVYIDVGGDASSDDGSVANDVADALIDYSYQNPDLLDTAWEAAKCVGECFKGLGNCVGGFFKCLGEVDGCLPKCDGDGPDCDLDCGDGDCDLDF